MTTRRQIGVIRGVDCYKDAKLKIEVRIDLRKDTGTFHAEYNDQHFTTNTLTKIKDEIAAFIRATTHLPWQPIIDITLKGGSGTFTDVLNNDMHGDEPYQRKHMRVVGDLDLEAKRYWLAKRPDGEWMSCEIWDSIDYAAEGTSWQEERERREKAKEDTFHQPEDRVQNAHRFYTHGREFSIPSTREVEFHGGDQFYLPYNEGTWQALNAIGDKVGDLVKQLQELIATDKGRLKLQAFSVRMLSSGKSEAVRK